MGALCTSRVSKARTCLLPQLHGLFLADELLGLALQQQLRELVKAQHTIACAPVESAELELPLHFEGNHERQCDPSQVVTLTLEIGGYTGR